MDVGERLGELAVIFAMRAADLPDRRQLVLGGIELPLDHIRLTEILTHLRIGWIERHGLEVIANPLVGAAELARCVAAIVEGARRVWIVEPLSRQISIGDFRRRIRPRELVIREQKQWNSCPPWWAIRQYRIYSDNAGVRPDSLIQSAKAVRGDSVISNCTGLEVFCCTTIAREATRSP